MFSFVARNGGASRDRSTKKNIPRDFARERKEKSPPISNRSQVPVSTLILDQRSWDDFGGEGGMDRGVVRELAWKKDPLPLDGIARGLAFDCRRKHNGRLNRVLTELAGTQIDPLPGKASLAGLGWNKCTLLRADSNLPRGSGHVRPRGRYF